MRAFPKQTFLLPLGATPIHLLPLLGRPPPPPPKPHSELMCPSCRQTLNQPSTHIWEDHQWATAILAEQLVSPSRNTLMGQQGKARGRKEKVWKLVHHGVRHMENLEICPGACAYRVLS